MKKITQYIPFHIGVILSIGIGVGYYYSFSNQFVFIASTVLLLLLMLINNHNKRNEYNFLFQFISYVLTFFIGVGVVFLHNPIERASHYSNFIEKDSKISFQITEKLRSNQYYAKYYADVFQIDKTKTQGKILLNIKKDTLSKNNSIIVGDFYLSKAYLKEINKPLNPHTFDYAAYLYKKGIIHQVSTSKSKLLKLNIQNNSLQVTALMLRAKLEQSLNKYSFTKDELGVIKALVLGQRREISKDLRKQHIGAGAVHILAVSGLHIGILFLILSFLLNPLAFFPKGKYIKAISIVIILWGFAMLTGLSASVVRSVTMFSFVALGMLIKNTRSPVLHSIFASYLLLLLIHPIFLFDVGFQMSYTALLGIVLLQPKIVKLFPNSKYWLFIKTGQLVSVSIAATIGTLPLSLYYFHQFPGLFVFSNVLIVPAIGLIMSIGIFLVVFSTFFQLPFWFIEIYGFIISMMNALVRFIAEQEAFLFKNISFSLPMLIMSYLVILTGYRWWETKKTAKQFSFLTTIILLFLVLNLEQFKTHRSSEFVVFHKSRASVIGVKQNDNQLFIHSLDSLKIQNYSFVKSYQTKNSTQKLALNNTFPSYFTYKNTKILVVDSLGIYKNIGLKPDLIYLRESPKINMQRLINENHPTTILADGPNYKSYITTWKRICKQNKIDFHYTGYDGAYILK